MLNVIQKIITQIKQTGNDCDYVAGTKEFMSAPDSEVPMFRFEHFDDDFDTKTKDSEIYIPFFITLPSRQDTNDYKEKYGQMHHLLMLSELFIEKLKAFLNDDGQQLFTITRPVKRRQRYDLQLMQHPSTVLIVELYVTQYSPNHCVWQD